jgi:hypothetical protein
MAPIPAVAYNPTPAVEEAAPRCQKEQA